MKYQKLFDYMLNEHGVTLLEQDMKEICLIVNEIQETKPPKTELLSIGSYEQRKYVQTNDWE